MVKISRKSRGSISKLKGLDQSKNAFFQEKFSFQYLISLLSIIIRDFNNKILILLSNSQVVKKSKCMRRGVCFSAKVWLSWKFFHYFLPVVIFINPWANYKKFGIV